MVHTVVASPAFTDHATYAAPATAASLPSARIFFAWDLIPTKNSCMHQKRTYAAKEAHVGSAASKKKASEIALHSSFVAKPPASVVSVVSAAPNTARAEVTTSAPFTPNATLAKAGKESRYETAGFVSASRYGDASSVPAAVDAATCHHLSGAIVNKPHRAYPIGTRNVATATPKHTQYHTALSFDNVTGTRGRARFLSTGSPEADVLNVAVIASVRSSSSCPKNASIVETFPLKRRACVIHVVVRALPSSPYLPPGALNVPRGAARGRVRRDDPARNAESADRTAPGTRDATFAVLCVSPVFVPNPRHARTLPLSRAPKPGPETTPPTVGTRRGAARV
mmetsp:Transcript_9892/g.36718  ORF Transcript_9892/g.36718 Transcript_9892/m.36718 type:complete len:339 (-) Transcript_9892:249-1265(-)